MKLIYIPKYRNEKRPFKITQIIQRVILNEDVDGLIFLPGYMSSSQGTIQNFISQMQNLGVKNKTVLLFNGMNGSDHLPLGNNIRDEHLKVFAQNNTILNFIQKKNLKDHRKMLFFFKCCLKDDLNRSIFIDDLSSFFSSIKIIGMLIGSSNQSFSTYFSTAQKGEADLLMLHDGASFGNYKLDTNDNEENGKNTLIMATSNSVSDSDEYFKNILRDIFENSF